MNMQTITFDDFFTELYGYPPFPWQSRLAERVIQSGWPQTIDLPTSSGKTVLIDIAVFHLAREASKPASKRQSPMRIFFVVDRRIVVDEAFERAQHISVKLEKALATHKKCALKSVAQSLYSLGNNKTEKPLTAIKLRGGISRTSAFIKNPFQPSVITSTVDQVGSRLLFRGYGVSEFMRPIHAALVGMDSLIILDEVHLSQPLAETLNYIKHYQTEKWAKSPVGLPMVKVEMSATPLQSQDVFSLEPSDWTDESPLNKKLFKRLTCLKPAVLHTITGDKNDPTGTRKQLEKEFVKHAKFIMADLIKRNEKAPVVGIVANRVKTARNVFEHLRKNSEAHDVILLTGRMRPFERDKLIKEFLPRIKAGRAVEDSFKPLYVVATQTIEVGADLDFHALVTEVAPIDALRQRFGRVNRLGNYKSVESVIIYINNGRSVNEDYVYGNALSETGKWLTKIASKQKVVDFTIAEMEKFISNITHEKFDKLLSPKKEAPVLLPAHLDLLAQTSPSPSIDPDISLFLHGPDTQRPDVRVVWRADLPKSLSVKNEKTIINTVTCLPPVQQEILEIPIWAIRAYLSTNAYENIFDNEDISDVEGGNIQNNKTYHTTNIRYVLKWTGPDESRVVTANEINPGDTLVLPSSYGGLDEFGWNPKSPDPVLDIAEDVQHAKGINVLRLHENLIPYWIEGEDQKEGITTKLEHMMNRFQSGEDFFPICNKFLAYLLSLASLKQKYRAILESLSARRKEIIYPTPEKPQGMILQDKLTLDSEFSDDDDASSLGPQDELENHSIKVGNLAEVHGHQAGLQEPLTLVLKNAGNVHDPGKADPRFQALLFGGDRIKAIRAQKLYAKSSSLSANNAYAFRLARERSGFPRGGRHECYSVAIIEQNKKLQRISDEYKDLLLYLVGTHHGRGRPFMPSVEDKGMKTSFDFLGSHIEFSDEHHLERLDSGWTDRFWRMIRQYGYWGLAYLEMLLRLSDHICSSKEGLTHE